MKTVITIMTCLAAFCGGAMVQAAPLRVVTSIPDLADFVRQVGGEHVEVVSLSRGVDDPHNVPIKPSMIPRLRRADLFIQCGLDLEVAYAPALIQESRNNRLRRGQPGFLDLSKGVRVLDVPRSVDRAGGDVHPHGNPHYNLDPEYARMMVAKIAARLGQLDPAHAAFYDKRADAYRARLAAKIREWKARLAGRKVRFVSYHEIWSYFAARFGVRPVGTIQPKPGIEPGPRYINELTDRMKAEGIKLIVKESYFSDRLPKELAKRTGARVVTVPVMVGGTRAAKDYISLMDTVVKAFVGE
jgi:zinc/manganese transport system substrate-binding protein